MMTERQLHEFNFHYDYYLLLNNNCVDIKWNEINISFIFKYNNINNNDDKPICVCAHYVYIDLLELLIIKYKADVDSQDVEGCTALMYACRRQNSEMIKLFLRYDANINIKDNSGKTCFDKTNDNEIINLLNSYRNGDN